MSRRPRAGVPSGSLTIRVTEDERLRWEAAAICADADLSAWLRPIVERAAARAQNTLPTGMWAAAIAQARKARR